MSYITGHWSFDPFVIVVAFVVVLHERGLSNLKRRSRPEKARNRRISSVVFYAGLAVLLLAVVSPIDYWAGYYFFAHMIEHILIMFFAPILIVARGAVVATRPRLPRGYTAAGYASGTAG